MIHTPREGSADSRSTAASALLAEESEDRADSLDSPKPIGEPRSAQAKFVSLVTPVVLLSFRLFLLSTLCMSLSLSMIGWNYYPQSDMKFFNLGAGITLFLVITILSRLYVAVGCRV